MNIDWAKLPNNIEIYALALKDTNEIQGIVGLKKDVDSKATFIQWACVAPHNNKLEHGVQKYLGMLHRYHVMIDENNGKKLLEVYHYEWNET